MIKQEIRKLSALRETTAKQRLKQYLLNPLGSGQLDTQVEFSVGLYDNARSLAYATSSPTSSFDCHLLSTKPNHSKITSANLLSPPQPPL